MRALDLLIVIIAEFEILEYLGDDFRNRLILKDPAVGRPSQKPKPWYDLCTVLPQPTLGSPGRKPADKSIEIPRGLVGQLDRECDVSADDVLGCNRRVLR